MENQVYFILKFTLCDGDNSNEHGGHANATRCQHQTVLKQLVLELSDFAPLRNAISRDRPCPRVMIFARKTSAGWLKAGVWKR